MGAWIEARVLRPARVTPPVSKSDAQRAELLAWLAGARFTPDPTDPVDVAVVRRGLRALSLPGAEIDCVDGGTPFRFLLGQAALRRGTTVFRGSPRLGEREHGPLVTALERALGPAGLVITRGTPWPVEVTGAPDPPLNGVFEVDASASSQFASSLLLACAALSRRGGAWRLVLQGKPASPGYLTLTLRWLALAGYEVSADLTVRFGEDRALPPPPRDWSSAAYLLALAWRAGGTVAIDPRDDHPDRAILDVLRCAGLAITPTPEGLAVRGEATSGTEASGLVSPDLLPTVAALAMALPGPTLLRHTGILRGKESDRRGALVAMVEAAGGTARGDDERLEIVPGPVPREIRVAVHGDHRLAMSAAVLAAVTGARVHVDDPAVVAKSFPTFWDEFARLGGTVA